MTLQAHLEKHFNAKAQPFTMQSKAGANLLTLAELSDVPGRQDAMELAMLLGRREQEGSSQNVVERFAIPLLQEQVQTEAARYYMGVGYAPMSSPKMFVNHAQKHFVAVSVTLQSLDPLNAYVSVYRHEL